MSEIRKYADLMQRSFGIEGVMTFAWYTLNTHRVMLDKLGLRPPHLILCGPPGCGKTELAKALASVDVPEGLSTRSAFHLLPNMSVEDLRKLINGAASFSVLEELKSSAPNDIIRQLKHIEQFSPLLLLTCIFPSAWQQLYNSYIVVEMPRRSFAQKDYQDLHMLKGAERLAYTLKGQLYKEPDGFREKFEQRKEQLLNCIREETTFDVDCFCGRLASYYAMIIAHWEAMSFDEERELEELSEYAIVSIINRLSIHEEQKKKKLIMQRTTDESGKVTLTWFHPDDSRQRLIFDDEQMFQSFAYTLRMMVSTQAESVEVCV